MSAVVASPASGGGPREERPRPKDPRTSGLSGGLTLSAVIHLAIMAAVWLVAARPEPVRPPVYRVTLMGAPAGARQAGVVTPKSSEPDPAPSEAPAGAERAAPPEKAMPSKARVAPPAKATPSAKSNKASGGKAPTSSKSTAKSPPKAGSGAVGGKGADVANVDTKGIEFPYPGYLNNIVRQLTLNWSPRRVSATLVTEVKFLVRRDGSVAGIEVVQSSGDRIYDIEATGAVEAVGSTRGFGPLPAGWKDDVLVVYFTFDYSLRP